MNALDLLRDLGSTTRQIIDALIQHNCLGKINSCGHCPIALYLTKKLGFRVMVFIDHVTDYNFTLICGLTVPIMNFIADYDRGLFPELVNDNP